MRDYDRKEVDDTVGDWIRQITRNLATVNVQKVAGIWKTAKVLAHVARGQLLEVDQATGTALTFVPHGLKRPFEGAFVVGQDDTAITVRVATPRLVRSSGGTFTKDPAKYFAFKQSAAGTPTNGCLRFWVF